MNQAEDLVAERDWGANQAGGAHVLDALSLLQMQIAGDIFGQNGLTRR